MKNYRYLIKKIFKNNKDNIAVKHNNEFFSYADLEGKVNKLSDFLEDYSINRSSVAIFVPKGFNHIVSILGVISSNNVFAPIDYKLPSKRVKTMFKEANIQFAIVDNNTKDILNSVDKNIIQINIDTLKISKKKFNVITRFDKSVSYIFFTSGSTGKPKAILGSYTGLIDFLNWEIKNFKIDSTYNVSFISAIGFDPMLRDIFVPLLVGGTLAIPINEEILDIKKFKLYLTNNKINLIHIVPTLFKFLFLNLKSNDLTNLKYIFLAGELLRSKDIDFFYNNKLNDNTKLINLYGPSETILAKFYHVITSDDLNKTYIPVGKPISKNKYKLINIEDNRGEILIIPKFKLLGYYNNPSKTEEVFFKKYSFSKYYSSFNTKDFGYIENGDLVLMGRVDSVIKHNGVRIDTNDIENNILSMDNITNAKVLYKNNCIVLIYSSKKEINKEVIYTYLSKRLPKQVLPEAIIYLKEFPLNHSNKIDLNELNKIYDNSLLEINNNSFEIINKILGLSKDDDLDFSKIDSLKLARLKNELQKNNIDISMKDLLNIKNISELDMLFKSSNKEIDKNINTDLNYCNILQEKMYYASKLANNSIYNIVKVIELSNKIDINKLKKSIRYNVDKIDLFKSIFYEDKGKIYYKYEDYKYRIENISYDKSIDNSINSWMKIFNLETDHLFQIGLLEHNNKKYLVFNIHHLIGDEYSLELLIKNIFNYMYDKTNINYEDFYKFLAYSNSEFINKDTIQFTKDNLNGICNIDLSYDYTATEIRNFTGEDYSISIDNISDIDKFVLNNGTTYYSLFSSILCLILAKYSQSEDITVSSPVSLRNNSIYDNTFGPLINVVPFRHIINYDNTILEYIKSVLNNNSIILDHPFIDISNILFEDKSNNINISYTFHDKRQFDGFLNKHRLKDYQLKSNSSKFKLMFEVVLHQDKIDLRIEYDNSLFKKNSIKLMATHFTNCLNAFINSSTDTILKNISFISKEEIELYNNLDNLEAYYDKKISIVDKFREVAKKYPDNIALEYDDKTITYKELDKLSNIIANYILDKNISDETIGIISNKNIECIATMIGIIKSGNSYVPINITYPSDRINYIIEDLHSSTIFIGKDLINNYELNITNLVSIEDTLLGTDTKYRKVKIDQTHPLYVIYTSGTTGKPKGAILTHRNLYRLLFNSKFQYDFTDKDIWTMFHSYCFDFSVWEMYGALLYGGKLILIKDNIAKDPKKYLDLLKEKKVTVLNQTPSYFYKLNEEELNSTDKLLNLRYLVFGGEALDISKTKLFKKKHKETRIINMYGITETTVHVTFKEITENDYKSNNSNIGIPIPTLKIVLLDKNKNLQVVGTPGEMYVIGDGVCNGYVNNPKLTSERFELSDNCRMYKSGDLAKLTAEGELVYLGRNDDQVKIRGFRIELGEIENGLKKVAPCIKDLVITTRYDSDNNPNIAVYYTSDTILDVSVVKHDLLDLIPEYMLPSYIIHVDSIPLTVNGKADRKLLNSIPIEINSNKKYIKPSTKEEKEIETIWKSVLEINKISTLDNFFDIGGNSFKALKASYMSDGLFSITDLYENPTIESLAKNIGKDNNNYVNNLYYYKKIDKPKANVILVPFAGGETIIYNDLAKYLKKYDVNISVINCNGLTKDFNKELDNIANDLVSLNDSPFIIYSHCAGDGVGVYLNDLLKKKGASVNKVIIGASLPPTINKNEYFEVDFWKNSTNDEIVKYLEGLDNSINYNELDKLDLFINNFRTTVMIRRDLLYSIHNNIKDKSNALIVVGLDDPYTYGYLEEANNWNEYVNVEDVITIEKGQHYFINSHYKKIGEIISKCI